MTANSVAPPKKIGEILAVPFANRSDGQKKTLPTHYRTFAPELADARKERARPEGANQTTGKGVPDIAHLCASGQAAHRAHPAARQLAGRLRASGQPTVPARLNLANLEGRSSRSDLADWVVSKKNPLTARVMVNDCGRCVSDGDWLRRGRLWRAGHAAYAPELLDWLAADFMDHGWDIKRTLKLLVISGRIASRPPRPETMDPIR
ncbi:MAG: hypothetical protein CM1200mP29_09130 [Verrucomicrobiota bacterium]|nr:MAG: hypothetical protein CM1200mP29_09130 [Verrucomicrobiota bacterium]